MSGTAWLLKYDNSNARGDPITCVNIVNVVLWVWISTAPFVQVFHSIFINIHNKVFI